MIDRMERRWRKIRRGASRSELEAKWLKLPRSERDEPKPGLILVQIDGLSRPQFERALKSGHLPFLQGLIKREHYKLHSHFSGVPSTTPSVQGELFYGVKQAVPAFSFCEHETGCVVRMLDPAPAAKVQERIAAQGEGLLAGGSAYSNIYNGGAEESHFCAATWGWRWIKRALNPFVVVGLLAANWWSVIRIAALLALETGIAVVDVFRGLMEGKSFWMEFKFIFARVAICILLREVIVIGSKIDIARGLPVVHMNFLGYDEQAHRRGPGSRFAHWSLKGIDDSIKRVWTAAHASLRRHYEVWIYSDHGQSKTIPYILENGRTIQAAVAEIFGEAAPSGPLARQEAAGIQQQRVGWIGLPSAKQAPAAEPVGEAKPLQMAAMGPVGHIYPGTTLGDEEKERYARRLVEEANVPLALVSGPPGEATAWTREGKFKLPEQRAAILGADHPFLDEAAADLVELCRHPDAGQIVISGWRLGKTPISFPRENGSHAGPGPEETHGFALLPRVAPVRATERKYLRPIDIRHAALRTLGRTPEPFYILPSRERAAGALRVMTYNVHSCVGMDGRVSVERIARVIMESDPDVVALQELDVGRGRTGGMDQAHEIARHLEMDFHFHPALMVEEERYGDAILSRLPMRLIKAGGLPTAPGRRILEPRGALWVAVESDGAEVHLLNTHLGLRKGERRLQTRALLGEEWLGHAECCGPVALLGDLNAWPGMQAYRAMCSSLRDAQDALDGHRPKGTWFTRVPLMRLDHIFVNESLEVAAIEVPKSRVAKIASDHLPLIADLRVRK